MANESARETVEKLKRNLEGVVIAVLAILLAVSGFLYSREQGLQPPESKIVPKASLDPVLPNETSQQVDSVFYGARDIKQSPYIRLIRFNIFQIISKEDRTALEQRATAGYAVAQQLFREHKIKEARQQCERILEILPNHRSTQELMNSIDIQLSKIKPPAPGAGAGTGR